MVVIYLSSDKLSFNLLTNAKVMAMASKTLLPKIKIFAKAQLTLITFIGSLINYLGPVVAFF